MNRRLELVGAIVAVVVFASGCVIPTVSMHSTRNVLVSINDVESGKPISRVAVSVNYYYDMLTPLFLHYEFRTPPAARLETGETGQALIPMADYSGRIVLDVETTNWWARFEIDKRLVRKGGALEQRTQGPTIRLRLDPMKVGANFSLHWTGSSRFSLVSMATSPAAAPGQ